MVESNAYSPTRTAADAPRESGFTLIELLVVSGLLAVLAGILYGTTSGLLSGREIVEQQRQNGQIAQYVFERMSRELTGRYLIALANKDNIQSGQSVSGGPGSFAASAQSPYAAAGTPPLYFLGESEKKGGEHADRVRFVSANAAQAGYGVRPNFGLVEIQYRLEKADALSYDKKRRKRGETYVLVREEFPAGVNSAELIDNRTYTIPLANNVIGFNVRYLRDGKWEDQWEEARIQLPEAIEITLKLEGSEGQQDTFRTAVAISRRRRAS